jgi:hypothetical protein
MGSPPPAESKNVVFKFLSVNNIVILPASTGSDTNNNIAVINTVQTNKGNLLKNMPLHRIFTMVTIKFIAPAIDETPAICKLKIAISTDEPE